MNWWTTKVTTPGKTENDVAEEIQVFRVEGPPPTTRDTASDDDMEYGSNMDMEYGSEQARTDLTSALRLLRADIRFGTAPRTKATKQLPLVPQSLLQTSFRPLEKILSKRSQGTLLRGMSSPCNSLVCFLLPKHIMGSIMHPNADACSRHRRSSLFGKITSGSLFILLQIYNRYQVS